MFIWEVLANDYFHKNSQMLLKASVESLTFKNIVEISDLLKSETKGLSSLEEVCQCLTRLLCQIFSDSNDNSELALCRIFKSCSFDDFLPELQKNICENSNENRLKETKYLTLLGTFGEKKEWCSITKSKNHKAIPLTDQQTIQKLPMVSALFNQIGFNISQTQESGSLEFLKKEDKEFGLFIVEEAERNPVIPNQKDFVIPFGVKSVLGFGGLFATGNIFSVLLFSKKRISPEKAEIFHSLVPAFKFILAENELRGSVFNDYNNNFKRCLPVEEIELTIEKEKALALNEELVRSNQTLVDMFQILTKLNLEMKKVTLLNQQILDGAGEGIYGLDLNGNTNFANPAAEKMLGYSINEMKDISQHDLIHHSKPDGTPYPREECKIYAAFNDGAVHHVFDEVFWRKDGSCFSVEYTSTPIYEEDKLKGAVVIFKDITEKKRYEANLIQSAEELKRSNDELQEFAFIASHDLQEPLRKVSIFGGLLEKKSKNLDETSRSYITRMQGAVLRMQQLIEDLLKLSGVNAKARIFSQVNLSQVVNDSMFALDTLINETNAEINVDQLPIITASPVLMLQLFQNLIGNALKFHKNGNKPIVNLFSKSSGNGDMQIIIEDNGIGFDEKYAKRIFQPFQRLHGRSEFSGTGIGLAICRKIVDRHNGTVTVKSTQGKGSTFFITLPKNQVKT
ncbi:MAG: PAS domain S-box-containing protein [Nitrospinales bacterium]|jgi:PAS domain S-box-containing protein